MSTPTPFQRTARSRDRRRRWYRHSGCTAGPAAGRPGPGGKGADPRPGPGAAPVAAGDRGGLRGCPRPSQSRRRGADTVISAVHGFAGPGRVSPATVDRAGNSHLIDAVDRIGAAFVLISLVGTAPDHPIGLFRAKYAAEQALRASGISWTIVRATAFMETWGKIMEQSRKASGKILVFGRGTNPVNFVSATDVATLVSHAVVTRGLRSQVLEIGGPDNLTFDQVASLLQETIGSAATVRHIPRLALHAMAMATAGLKPELARQARAALAMDAIDMTFDPSRIRRAFPQLPNTDMATALKALLA
jgi:uncharacterized protein YbjT (DUF2867 family)